MKLSKDHAVRQLTEVLADYQGINEASPHHVAPNDIARVATRMQAAINRLAPNSSSYRAVADSTGVDLESWPALHRLAGAAEALKADYEGDCLDSYRELITAELCDDFLSMAEFLLTEEALKDPAAVLAGGVIEEHLRKLCAKHGIPTTTRENSGQLRPKKLDTMNAELTKQTVYGKNEQKQVTAWAGIRNDAAHAKYDKYVAEQVHLMIQGIRVFISRFPA
jgi:hypothetical protein